MSTAQVERFVDGGEAGAVLRAKDWSKTPLGPSDTWPRYLVNYVNMVLEMPGPAILFWGPELTQIYNDGYSFIMGPRHPEYYGAAYRDCWPDTYPIISPWMARVFQGETITVEKTFFELTRHGFREEAYFTFTFSALRDDTGAIVGILQPVTEVTGIVLSERRAETLHALAPRATSEDPTRDAIEALAANPKDIPFALIYLWDEPTKQLRLAARSENLAELESGFAPLAEAVQRAVDTNTALKLDQAGELLGGKHLGPWPDSARAAFILPMRRSHTDEPKGAVVFGLNSATHFDDKYRGFLEVAAGQVATAIDSQRALREAQQRAESLAELDRAKTLFFSNVSHEFRTPLTLMLGPTEDALASPERVLQGQELEMVHRNELRLLKLVNMLLDFSRVEAGRIEASYEPTDLSRMTGDFAEAFRPAVERAGLGLRVECPPLPESVYVDQGMWEKIVLNLLSNALKFTFAGEIAVSLRWLGPQVELVVRDTGTGIPPKELPHVFKRFHRVQGARSRTHEGSGIGLALVQELVKLHGGTITAESTLDQGTTFTLLLPTGSAHLPREHLAMNRRQAPTSMGVTPYLEEARRWSPDANIGARVLAAPASDSAAPAQQLLRRIGDAGMRILLADDNADMRDYVTGLLSQHWTVDTVSDGVAALESIHAQPPDLVITDVMMPRLDGFGLIQAIRADPRTRAIPVIMLSARAGEEAPVEGLEAGADDYLVKPFSARELLARVGARLEIHRLNQDLERRVRERTSQLEESNRELESFSYSVSHDLRAPLRHILGFAQLMEKNAKDGLDARTKGYLKIISEAARQGGQLVDDLLAFSRLGRAELNKRRVVLSQLVTEVRTELAPEAEGRKVHWDIKPLPEVSGDPALLRMVLKNLLSNALKYTRPRAEAHIEVGAREGANEVEVWIKDNGVGFDMAYVDKLFGVFQRLHTVDQFEGTGIGLAHVRRIVSRHGGRTWAEGALDAGATLHFTLPRPAPARA